MAWGTQPRKSALRASEGGLPPHAVDGDELENSDAKEASELLTEVLPFRRHSEVGQLVLDACIEVPRKVLHCVIGGVSGDLHDMRPAVLDVYVLTIVTGEEKSLDSIFSTQVN